MCTSSSSSKDMIAPKSCFSFHKSLFLNFFPSSYTVTDSDRWAVGMDTIISTHVRFSYCWGLCAAWTIHVFLSLKVWMCSGAGLRLSVTSHPPSCLHILISNWTSIPNLVFMGCSLPSSLVRAHSIPGIVLPKVPPHAPLIASSSTTSFHL